MNGSVSNPDGQGAIVRAIFKNGSKGPSRLIGGSAGRFSQGSFCQILGGSRSIRAIEVHWPGGEISVKKVTNTAMNLVLNEMDSQ